MDVDAIEKKDNKDGSSCGKEGGCPITRFIRYILTLLGFRK
jgi:hypothetical protein